MLLVLLLVTMSTIYYSDFFNILLLELRSRKTVRFSEQIMSADKYPCLFSRQMEAIINIMHAAHVMSLSTRAISLAFYGRHATLLLPLNSNPRTLHVGHEKPSRKISPGKKCVSLPFCYFFM